MASSQCHRDALKARNTSEKAGTEQPRESGPQPAQVTGLALCGPDIVQLHEALTPSRALDIPASLRASQNNCDLPTLQHQAEPVSTHREAEHVLSPCCASLRSAPKSART